MRIDCVGLARFLAVKSDPLFVCRNREDSFRVVVIRLNPIKMVQSARRIDQLCEGVSELARKNYLVVDFCSRELAVNRLKLDGRF